MTGHFYVLWLFRGPLRRLGLRRRCGLLHEFGRKHISGRSLYVELDFAGRFTVHEQIDAVLARHPLALRPAGKIHAVLLFSRRIARRDHLRFRPYAGNHDCHKIHFDGGFARGIEQYDAVNRDIGRSKLGYLLAGLPIAVVPRKIDLFNYRSLGRHRPLRKSKGSDGNRDQESVEKLHDTTPKKLVI